MKRRTEGLVYLLIVIGILIIGTLIVFRTQSERIAIRIGDVITARFGEERNLSIDVGDIGGSLLGDIILDDVCISYTGEEVPKILLSAQRISGNLNLISLLGGKVKFDSIHVASPTLVVPLRSDGTRIYPSGDVKPEEDREPSGFEIAKIAVTDASIRWEGEEARTVTDLSMVGSYEQDAKGFTVAVRSGSFTYGEAGRVDGIAGMMHSLHDRVRVIGARIRTPNSRVGISGWFGKEDNDSLAIGAKIDSLDLGEVSLFSGSKGGQEIGTIEGRVNVAGQYSKLLIELDLSGEIRGWIFRDLIAGAVYEDQSVTVSHLSSLLNGTPISLSGKYAFATPPRYEGIVAFSDLDLSRFIVEDAEDYFSDLAGTIRFKGQGLDSRLFKLTTWPELDAGAYRDWSFDSVDGVVVIDSKSVDLGSVVARVGEARIETRGRIGFDGDLGLAFGLDCPRLEHLFPYHRVEGLHGAVASVGSLAVSEGRLAFALSSEGTGLEYTGTLVESLVIDIDLERAGGILTGQSEMFASGVDIHGFKSTEFIGNILIEDHKLTIDRAVFTRDDGSLLGVAGNVEIAEGGFDAGIAHLFVGLGGFIWENEDTILVSYRQDSLSVGAAEFSSDIGRVSIENSSYVRGCYSTESRFKDFDLSLLGDVLKRDIPTGKLNLALTGSGTADSLTFDLGFNITHGEIQSVAFESLRGDVRYDGETLWIEGISLNQNGGSVSIEGMTPLDLAPSSLGPLVRAGRAYDMVGDLGRIAIRAEDIDISLLEPLVPPVAKLGGLAELAMEISGNKTNPRIVTGGRLREAFYGEVGVGDVAWNLVVEDSLLRVVELTFGAGREKGVISGDIPIAISILPFSSVLLERSIDVAIKVESGNLGLMCEVIPRLKVCSGTYGADLRIVGDARDPEFYGDLTLADARLRFEGVAQDLRDISLDMYAEGNRFVLSGMTAEGGALRATGFFLLEGMKISDWRFDLRLKDFAVTEFEDFYARIDGNLVITAELFEPGKPVPRIEGSLRVKEGEYFYSMTGGTGEGTIIGPSASPSWVMNVAIEVPNAFWIRGDDIQAELQGDLEVKRDREGLLVLGTLRTLRGTFYIYHNVFRITRGEFRFTDVTSLKNVYIELEAHSRVLDERIDLSATGSIDKLDIRATSESNWSETQIFEALTLRRGEVSEGAEEQRFFSDEFVRAWGVALVNRFGNDVARELRLDRFEVEVGDVVDGDMLATTRVTFAKYVSDKVYLEYTQSIGSLYEDRRKLTQRGLSFPERQLSVEYRLSDRLAIEGETGTVGGLGYFDVDLKFRFGY